MRTMLGRACDSRVWVLQEIATFGEVPYPTVDYTLVLDKLETGALPVSVHPVPAPLRWGRCLGYRMPRPEGCPPKVYTLMLDCESWRGVVGFGSQACCLILAVVKEFLSHTNLVW